ncbi:FtsP/CotA-like multicopper oxidase with cupredoxin domain [Cytobacillus firmus]|uniref:FtsP/CotA-like multicopper oxidase with cupredoxin domain n=2 Tax=Cytobacillus TaxID=2675230 RepID=A0A366JMX4_CYTFI|nr:MULTISPECIES: multicopper oxidase domain-containing protein [Cytobacillus]RBP87615.1 FtsP/CotA-like multicopper oxidase with cupredoxin domain [Cytobacillus firmus]TDX39441.1 FtsP/CotA-like multicopper oxidase with cupredoxin domain [Cytobacillus oceanisediminis]
MKSKFWIFSLLISTVMIGGCSAGDAQPENESEKNQAMDHTKMKPEQKMGDMEEMEGHMNHVNPPALNDSTEENELAVPPLLEPKDGSYPITAQQGTTELFEGIQTETYGYNGSFLGPVIRIKRGDAVTFKTRNGLTEPTTFHWHGLDIPGKGDGGPHQIIEPGETKYVKFTVNQEASTLWFHPHQKGITAEQVYKGLAGLIYVEDENSQKLGLPDHYGVNDFPLVFQDRQFDDKNQLNFKAVHNDDGTIGNTLLVNGTLNPKLTVGAEKVRLRLLNGSNARNYTFKLNTGDSFQQIATDGGFLNEPLEMSEITLTPGERAEIIVDFSRQKSDSDIALLNEEDTILLPFKVKKEQTNSAELPESLNDYKVTDEERSLSVSKRLELFGMGKHVTINKKQFDMNRIDFTQKQGETEIWEVYNKPDPMGGMIHPFHIHGTQFKIVSIDGEDPPEILQGWKDTVAIEPGQTVKLAVKFKNKGIYMYHCHLLEHEDNGMMGQVEVN